MGCFSSAKPIFPRGMETDMNRFIGFRSEFPSPRKGHVCLRMTGSTIFRVRLNGQFVAYGPARGPHGYYRVDEIPVPDELLMENKNKQNILTVELASYNVNSYYLLDQPGFLQAEVVTDSGNVLAATGSSGMDFAAYNLSYRMQKVARFSFQRPFSEVYRMNEASESWLSGSTVCDSPKLSCEDIPEKRLLPRRVAFPDYNLRQPMELVSSGTVEPVTSLQPLWKDHSFSHINPLVFKGFLESELEATPSLEIQKVRSHLKPIGLPYDPEASLDLSAGSCHILDLGGDCTGFIGFSAVVHEPTKLLVSFDEVLTENDVNFMRLGCIQIVSYDLAPGTYSLESFEPYVLRYLKFQTLSGGCSVRGVYLREYCNPDIKASFACSVPELNFLYLAGVDTFRQNTLDIPMDCPSRERAGWLCDSFFISRVAFDVSGHSIIEKNYLENYLLSPQLPQLPEGMLPMCYPSDHTDGNFIPQWSLWFVIELEEYLNRSGDRKLVDLLKPRVLSLLKWFVQYRNSDGLLEKLPAWNFIEWSAANDFVYDVNYPTNMLYTAALRAVDRIYHLPELQQEAETLLRNICKQSFDGEFFVDNAVRSADGALLPTRNRTEVCQYYAYFFDIVTPKTHHELWRLLSTKFGPKRRENNPFPDVHFANAFIGNYLRMELLSRYGLEHQMLSEIQSYFMPMAIKTRTLWEHMDVRASCNHGFASHVVRWLFRDACGIQAIDPAAKKVMIRFPNTDLSWCQVKMPLTDGELSLEWNRKPNGEVDYHLSLPAGYRYELFR